MFFSIATIAAFVAAAAAHGGVTSYQIAGVTYTGWSPYNSPSGQTSIERPYSSYDPYASLYYFPFL
jgi:lytic cellulose monooxygenase (C1-hydroxylating)